MNSLPALRPDVTLDWLNELGTEYLPGFLGVEMLELETVRALQEEVRNIKEWVFGV